jgi:hypothetical protein
MANMGNLATALPVRASFAQHAIICKLSETGEKIIKGNKLSFHMETPPRESLQHTKLQLTMKA